MTTGKSTGEHTTSTPHEATFGMKRAAEVAGVSVSTIRRNKELLREHGAVLDPDGWKVPMSALIASGLMRRTTPPDQPAPAPRGAAASTDNLMHERVKELERENLELRHQAELEAVKRSAAEQRTQDVLRALELAEQKMLTAGPDLTTTTISEPGSLHRESRIRAWTRRRLRYGH